MSEVLHIIITVIYLLGVPLLVVCLSYRWSFINKVSPMMVLYCIGLLVGNIGIIGSLELSVCSWTSNIAVPIAIPLMLMSCDFRKWSTRVAVKAFAIGVISIVIAIILGYFIFLPMARDAGVSTTDYAKMSGAMTGIYTGGIPNIGPVSKAVGLPNNLYLLVTSYDLIATGLYLLFVIFFGKIVFRRLLPPKVSPTLSTAKKYSNYARQSLFGKELWRSSLFAIFVAVIIAAVSYSISLILPLSNSVAVLILVLTTLSLCISFIKPVRAIKHSFDLGLYCVYVFCFAIANMVNISELNLIDNIFILYYVASAIFGSMVLQIVFAKIFKLDGDTVLVSSVALINSPPFVPLVAATLGNRDIILTGMGIGLMGYAIGNYLGIGIYELLVNICI